LGLDAGFSQAHIPYYILGCCTYLLKLSIELILDQKIEEKKKADKDKLVDKQIKDIQQNI